MYDGPPSGETERAGTNRSRSSRNSIDRNSCNVRHGKISATVISIVSCLRGFRLLVATRPQTPLRVLCLIAFDTLHVFRRSSGIPCRRIRTLAALLDFQACANAAFDSKPYCRSDYRATRRLLDDAGFASVLDEYLLRLRELEQQRPPAGGDHSQFATMQTYREDVVRLSLGTVAAAAFGYPSVADGIQATQHDPHVALLFRIVMLCQIIDDVLDFSKDKAAGLPGFLTVPASLRHAFERTREAAVRYADVDELSRSSDLFPLRLALRGMSIWTRLIIACGRWRQRSAARLFVEIPVVVEMRD